MTAGQTPGHRTFRIAALAVLAVVGLARLGLSLSGMPDSIVRWVSMNVVGWTAALAWGVVAARSAPGYRRLLPFAISQAVVFHSIAILGILLTIAGWPNIYAAPEFSGPAAQSEWLHAASHLTLGMLAASLLWWGAACLSRLVTRKLAREATPA
ncbi:MAG: hypothetical protein U0599_24525 [Vicinamibacteria bacterium]